MHTLILIALLSLSQEPDDGVPKNYPPVQPSFDTPTPGAAEGVRRRSPSEIAPPATDLHNQIPQSFYDRNAQSRRQSQERLRIWQERAMLNRMTAWQRRAYIRSVNRAKAKAIEAVRIKKEQRLKAGIIDAPTCNTPEQLRAALVYGQVVITNTRDNGIAVKSIDMTKFFAEKNESRGDMAPVSGLRGAIAAAIYLDNSKDADYYKVLMFDGVHKGQTIVIPICYLLLDTKYPKDQAVIDAYDSKKEMKDFRLLP